jgi:hypothetical protein
MMLRPLTCCEVETCLNVTDDLTGQDLWERDSNSVPSTPEKRSIRTASLPSVEAINLVDSDKNDLIDLQEILHDTPMFREKLKGIENVRILWQLGFTF